MSGVWIEIRGLPPKTTTEEVHKLTKNRAITVETHDINTVEAAGRILVSDMDDARLVLRTANYVMHRGGLVKLSLTQSDLVISQCFRVSVSNLAPGKLTERRLYKFSKEYGTVCKLAFKVPAATIWFGEEKGASAFVEALKTKELCTGGVPVVEVVQMGKEPMEVDIESSPEPSPPPPPPPSSTKQQKKLPPIPKKPSVPSSENNAQQQIDNEERIHILRSRTGRSKSTTSFRQKKTSSKKLQRKITATSRRVGSSTPSALVMDRWQDRAPFIYDFIYQQKPEIVDENGSTQHMPTSRRKYLSMAWCPSRHDQREGVLDFYSSVGNQSAADTIKNWSVQRNISPPDSKSMLTISRFRLPHESSLINMASTLETFYNNHIGIRQHGRRNEDNSCAITSLKLHDEGRILFGCGMRSILVYDAENFKQKGTLKLLDEVDGCYDVGKGYVVANSGQCEVGVWKAGSRNYLWRYNDTRRFRNMPAISKLAPLCETRITALRVAANDNGVFVGNSDGVLSYSDFRERSIWSLSSSHRGVIRSIEQASQHEILVGTEEGDLRLLDTRCIREARTSPLAVYDLSNANYGPVSQIRMCPHNPDLFACSVDSAILMYYKQHGNQRAPIFCHEAHRTLVVDFDWHPCRSHMYTIGSIEAGTFRGEGCLQFWRPVDEIFTTA